MKIKDIKFPKLKQGKACFDQSYIYENNSYENEIILPDRICVQKGENKMEQTLKFLGRGSAFNVKEGNTSAYIKENETLFLIDCGSNIFERIINKKLLNGVKNVYVAITHRHPDHVGSLGDLIFYCYYILGIKVKLLANDFKLSEYLLLNGVQGELYEWFKGDIKELNKMYVASEPTHHISLYKDKNNNYIRKQKYHDQNTYEKIFDCYYLRLIMKGKQIFYSGDCSALPFYNLEICDELYFDCCIADYDGNVHCNIDKLYNELRKNKCELDKVFCMHFDCDRAIDRAKELGFNVVECE